MRKRKKSDPLISVLEHALDLGEFIPYNRSWDFVRGLEEVKQKIDALSWVEKGLKLEKKDRWGNQSGAGLTGLQQDLLNKLGRREDAFALAWAEFKKHPSSFAYETLMKFVDAKNVKLWHQKALKEAKDASLSGFIDNLC